LILLGTVAVVLHPTIQYHNTSRAQATPQHSAERKQQKMSGFHSSSALAHQTQTGDAPGFSFHNVQRNAFLASISSQSNIALPSAKKTGTTIVGMIYKDGVVLGADTRATGGTEVADKNCEKIHYLADNIYCCGAGTAADTEMTTKLISSQLELLRRNTKVRAKCTASYVVPTYIAGVTLSTPIFF
jgi:hypothetical protein